MCVCVRIFNINGGMPRPSFKRNLFCCSGVIVKKTCKKHTNPSVTQFRHLLLNLLASGFGWLSRLRGSWNGYTSYKHVKQVPTTLDDAYAQKSCACKYNIRYYVLGSGLQVLPQPIYINGFRTRSQPSYFIRGKGKEELFTLWCPEEPYFLKEVLLPSIKVLDHTTSQLV